MFIRRVIFAVTAILFSTSAFAIASDIDKLMKYERFQSITPLDATSQMLSGDTQVRPDVTMGMDFTLFGEVARVNASGVRVYAQGANYYSIIGLNDFQLTYSRQDYSLKIHDSSGQATMSHNADVMKFKWVPGPNGIPFPWNGQLAIGGILYYDRSNSTRQNAVNFSQPYAAMALEYGRSRVNVGVNWLSGDLPEDTGLFASLQYQVNPEIVLYVDYNERDFHKIVMNQILLPRLGIDCSTCDNEALSAGMAFKFGDYGIANIGAYDILDLGAPMGSLSFTKEY